MYFIQVVYQIHDRDQCFFLPPEWRQDDEPDGRLPGMPRHHDRAKKRPQENHRADVRSRW